MCPLTTIPVTLLPTSALRVRLAPLPLSLVGVVLVYFLVAVMIQVLEFIHTPSPGLSSGKYSARSSSSICFRFAPASSPLLQV